MTSSPGTYVSTDEPRSATGAGIGTRADAHGSNRPVKCSQPVPSGIAFGAKSDNVEALDAALVQLEAAEQLIRESEAARVTALAEVDRVAHLEADAELGRRSAQRAAEDTLAYRAARADAAVMLHLSEQTVALHLAHAATLANSYPDTLASLASGAINIRHANVIVDTGHIIGAPGQADTAEVAANRAEYEVQVLAHATAVTPPQLKPIARRIAEAYAHQDLDTRYERARKDRKVWVTERENGLAELSALLPAHKAKAVYSRLTQMSKRGRSVDSQIMREAKTFRDKLIAGSGADTEASPAVESELWVPFSPLATHVPGRSMDEFRADLFSDLLLNGTGGTATGSEGTGIAGIVQIITHVSHLEDPSSSYCSSSDSAEDSGLGDRTEQALPEMEGYGPIPVSMARDIAAESGTWSDISVSLGTGTVLTVENYRPSEAIRRFLAARDQRCRFPGCRAPVQRCDFDHTVDAALGGPTSTTNLGALCRGHHILKHHSGWGVIQQLNGDYDWTSPTGRTTTDKPISRVLFRPTTRPKPDRPGSRPEGRTLTAAVADPTAHPF